jgi:predicted nucleic acid-binding protein
MALLAVYVETSVWSFAFAEDAPDYRADTLLFFDRCQAGALTPFVSWVVLDELDRAEPQLRERLTGLVRGVGPAVLDVSADAEKSAGAFLREHVVPGGKPEDARHVAVAFDHELDVLVSWNFRHIAGVRRADRFNAVAVLEGYYKPLRIVSPAEVLYDDETDFP